MPFAKATTAIEDLADDANLRPGMAEEASVDEREAAGTLLKECVICMAAPRSVRFACGHMLCCEDCTEDLINAVAQTSWGAQNKCPSCRARIVVADAPLATGHEGHIGFDANACKLHACAAIDEGDAKAVRGALHVLDANRGCAVRRGNFVDDDEDELCLFDDGDGGFERVWCRGGKLLRKDAEAQVIVCILHVLDPGGLEQTRHREGLLHAMKAPQAVAPRRDGGRAQTREKRIAR